MISRFLGQEQQRGWSLANAASALAAALYTVANDDAVENCSDAVRLNHIPHKNSKFKISSKMQTHSKRFQQILTYPFKSLISRQIPTDPNGSKKTQTDPNRSNIFRQNILHIIEKYNLSISKVNLT